MRITLPLVLLALLIAGQSASAGKHEFHGYYYNRPYHHKVARPYGQDWRTSGPLRGATALCRDGTTSFSEHPHAPGTCSGHGGKVGYPEQSFAVAVAGPIAVPVIRRGEPPIIRPYETPVLSRYIETPIISPYIETPIISPYIETPIPQGPCPNCQAPTRRR